MSRIYLRQDDGSLRPMDERAYASEDLLQELLEKYPDLLAGDQMSGSEPRRWLLVSREYGVPDRDQGGERWSLDHLFLDQDAIPTLVEVKRSSDTRLRREVVGQMLDYAANAVVYWPVENLRARFEAACEARGVDPAEVIRDHAGAGPTEEDDVEAFWSSVKTNLQAGRIRLVFVADTIPSELRRVVEFLNGQMDPAEVIAVEVRQFVGEGLQTLVPKVIGQTAAAQQRKGTSLSGEPWTRERFMAALREQAGDDAVAAAEALLAWIEPLVTRVYWGRGREMGSFTPALEVPTPTGMARVQFFAVWTYGKVAIDFQSLHTKAPFKSKEMRLELLRRLNAIPGVSLPEESITKLPAFPIVVLKDAKAMRRFREAIEWGLGEVDRAG